LFHNLVERRATTAAAHERELTPLPPGPTVEDAEDAPHTKDETLEVAPK